MLMVWWKREECGEGETGRSGTQRVISLRVSDVKWKYIWRESRKGGERTVGGEDIFKANIKRRIRMARKSHARLPHQVLGFTVLITHGVRDLLRFTLLVSLGPKFISCLGFPASFFVPLSRTQPERIRDQQISQRSRQPASSASSTSYGK